MPHVYNYSDRIHLSAGGRTFIELVVCLAVYWEGAELHREMAEGGVALGDGAQEGEKETGGAEFEETPEDES